MTDERTAQSTSKSATAFRTIGEVATELGVAQHVLRYWESRFPQLKPLQRAGNRRLYRPADVDLARRIHALLNDNGYSIRGVQKVLADRQLPPAEDVHSMLNVPEASEDGGIAHVTELQIIRGMLADALIDAAASPD